MSAREFKIASEKHEAHKEQWKALFQTAGPEKFPAFGYAAEQQRLRTALRGITAPVTAEVPFGLARGVQSGVFLHGPPGCGKTLLVEAAAAGLGLPAIVVQPAHIVTGDVGSTSQVVASLFEAAIEVAAAGSGAVIFMDEVESFGKRTNNGTGWEVFLSNLLKHIDRLSAASEGHRVAFVAATNNPNSCEPALLSRLSTHIEIGPPDYEARRAYLEAAAMAIVRTRFFVGAFDLDALVSCTAGQTLRQVAQALDELNATYIASGVGCAPLTQSDLISAFARRSVTALRFEDPAVG